MESSSLVFYLNRVVGNLGLKMDYYSKKHLGSVNWITNPNATPYRGPDFLMRMISNL